MMASYRVPRSANTDGWNKVDSISMTCMYQHNATMELASFNCPFCSV